MNKEMKLYLFSDEELDKLFVNIVIEMLKRSADKCVVACYRR